MIGLDWSEGNYWELKGNSLSGIPLRKKYHKSSYTLEKAEKEFKWECDTIDERAIKTENYMKNKAR